MTAFSFSPANLYSKTLNAFFLSHRQRRKKKKKLISLSAVMNTFIHLFSGGPKCWGVCTGWPWPIEEAMTKYTSWRETVVPRRRWRRSSLCRPFPARMTTTMKTRPSEWGKGLSRSVFVALRWRFGARACNGACRAPRTGPTMITSRNWPCSSPTTLEINFHFRSSCIRCVPISLLVSSLLILLLSLTVKGLGKMIEY